MLSGEIYAEIILWVEALYLVIIYMTVLEYKGKHRATAVLLLGTLIYLIQNRSKALWDDSPYGLLADFLNLATIIAVEALFFRGSAKRKTITIIACMTPLVLAELIGVALLGGIVAANGDSWSEVYQSVLDHRGYRTVTVVMSCQVLMVLWNYEFLAYKLLTGRRWIREYGVYLFMPLYQTYLLWSYYRLSGGIDRGRIRNGFLLCVFGVIVNGMLVYLVNGMIRKQQTEERLRLLYRQREQEVRYYTRVNEHMEQVREARHEFANQLQVIQSLLEEKDKEKAGKMLETMEKDWDNRFGVRPLESRDEEQSQK